jgi:FK506-binding protein 1
MQADVSSFLAFSQVILGWDIGVMQMSVGEKAALRISPGYGYGWRGGAGGKIPGGSELTFWVELVAINP